MTGGTLARFEVAALLLCLLAAFGCTPSPQPLATSGDSGRLSLDAAARSAAKEMSGSASELEYVGSVGSSNTAEPIAVYFAVPGMEPQYLAETATGLGQRLAVVPTETMPAGFELVLVGADGASVVRATFDRQSLAHADWASEAEGGSDDYAECFRMASSYEWNNKLDWTRLIDDDPTDSFDELPTASYFPQARWDAAGIGRLAAAAGVNWPAADNSIGTAKVEGAAPDRRVTLSFDSYAADDWLGEAARVGWSVMPRLVRDPTIGSVQIVLLSQGSEVLRVRYGRSAILGAKWDDRDNGQGWPQQVAFLTRSNSYRWTDKEAWDSLFTSGSIPRRADLPRSK